MDINEGTTADDLWTPYKELVSVVEGYLAHEGKGAPYAVHTFESVLRRHKQTFLSLFKNPPKNPASREEIKRGITEGVNLPSIGRTLLSKELVDEAIIISDMYNVSEYLALELLHTAQRQSPRHPGLPRGLVAILLYYDGRRALVQALKELVMARDGVCWSINAREEIISYVSRYVEQLIADGLLGNAMDALRRFTLDSEMELLQNNRALPPGRHHATLITAMESTRKLLAGVVFSASAQRGLSRDIILRIISEQTTSPTQGATGALDEISLGLQMALLYALDLSVLHRREDGEELAKKLPLIQEPELISVLLDELSRPAEGRGAGVRALCQLALGLALAALKRAPQSLLRRATAPHLNCDLLDQDEMLVDAAIDGKVFEYLDEAILSTDLVSKEEYYQRRIHTLITDFIVLMHSKLMEMRVKADEAARAVQMYAAEGLTAPGGTRTRLDALLRCVERLYARDPHGLRHAYWEAASGSAGRASGRAATLYKFVRLSGEVLCGALLAAYLRALASLAVPRHTWALLAKRDALSAYHLLTALSRYHSNLRADPAPFSEHVHASSLGASAIVTPAARPGKMLVRQEEVEALIAALKLIARVAREDQAACAAICENLQWDAVNCMFGLVCCHIPLQLKAELLLTLAALGGSAGTAGRVWAALEAARLVAPNNDKRALNAELHEVECRIEEYPLSRAFLSLLESLCAAAPLPRALGAGARAPGLDPYVEHALNRLALPAPHRPYAKPTEKWQMLSLCFRLFARWLEQYEPSPSDFPPVGREPDTNPPPGFRLLLQLHTKSEFLRLLLTSLDEAHELLDRPPQPAKEFIEQSLISILQILERALALERPLQTAAADAGRSVLIVPLSKLILAPEGPDNNCRLVTHALAAEIRYGFVECLEAEEWTASSTEDGEQENSVRQAKEGILVLLQHVLPTAPPNLAHFLLGYNLTDVVSRSTLCEAGAGGYPRTCLHAILDILEHHIADHNHQHKEANNLVESCYRLVYWLCARPNTSAPILRFLRTRDYFLSRHVKATVDLKTTSRKRKSYQDYHIISQNFNILLFMGLRCVKRTADAYVRSTCLLHANLGIDIQRVSPVVRGACRAATVTLLCKLVEHRYVIVSRTVTAPASCICIPCPRHAVKTLIT
uniref:Nuclear pore complex protein Nup205 n=1 Tax=Heliothis virescens TaxID=7102 RepID=A0A2A4J9G9_HELVI